MTNLRSPASLISRVMRWMPERRTCRTKRPTDPGVDRILAHTGPSPSSMPPPSFGGRMRGHYRTGSAAMLLMALIALSATVRSTAESGPEAQPQNERLPDYQPGKSPSIAPSEPTVTVLDHRDVQGVLGK